jgi:phospholipase/carboxylesterase
MTDLSLKHSTLPATAGSGPHPGLLLLHGRGADERDLLPLGPEIDSRLFTVAARGPLPFVNNGYAWYGLAPGGVGYPELASLSTSLALLDEFLDEIVSSYPIDPKRLYIAGFSMGGAMAAALALLHPERISGAMILSSYLPLHADLPYHLEQANGHPFFQAHGEYDPVIPVSFARETRDFLLTTPVTLTYREYPMAHQISGAELSDLQTWLGSVLEERRTSTTEPS